MLAELITSFYRRLKIKSKLLWLAALFDTQRRPRCATCLELQTMSYHLFCSPRLSLSNLPSPRHIIFKATRFPEIPESSIIDASGRATAKAAATTYEFHAAKSTKSFPVRVSIFLMTIVLLDTMPTNGHFTFPIFAIGPLLSRAPSRQPFFEIKCSLLPIIYASFTRYNAPSVARFDDFFYARAKR